jgi:hypothetical protein
MGLLWRMFAPKPLKKARRTVRKATHPVHTATRVVTPKPVKQLQRAAHPVILAELKIEDAAVNALRGKPRKKPSRRTAQVSKKTPAASKRNQSRQSPVDTAIGHERPAQVRDGIQAMLLGGNEDLEVVGESHYQENLWRLVSPRRRGDQVRCAVQASLVAEDDNPYDANAVAVWVQGLKVGHLSRDDARRYRPGLLSLQDRYSQPIALLGAIVGGGIREDGPGRLGVFLRHDPADFGLPASARSTGGTAMSPPPGPYRAPAASSPPSRKRAWPRRHPIWSALIVILVLFGIIGAATSNTSSTRASSTRASSTAAAPSPHATPTPVAHRSAPLACDAQAVNNRPADHTIAKIRVHTVARAQVTATGPLAFTRRESAASLASARGNRTLRFRVGNAPPGDAIVITVQVSRDGSTGSCQASLLPRPAPATAATAPAQPSAPPTSAPAPPPPTAASCYPLSDEGTCYEPGEFCRDSDHGLTGVAGDGEKIICEDNDGWRWEPY